VVYDIKCIKLEFVSITDLYMLLLLSRHLGIVLTASVTDQLSIIASSFILFAHIYLFVYLLTDLFIYLENKTHQVIALRISMLIFIIAKRIIFIHEYTVP
jgi:hypothetical protein